MNARLKIEKRRSEIRSRLGEIRGLAGDAKTSEIKAEEVELDAEFSRSEISLTAKRWKRKTSNSEPLGKRLAGSPQNKPNVWSCARVRVSGRMSKRRSGGERYRARKPS